ncbi:PP2C family protein-serine/threonine phosphatase [Xanthomonas euvesicatoria]|uniref:PP2C family protein-serine/threonine phosphatase n=1 Tax=Xanthomonas euvesicatoria TaxID=456327 RepID=UPI001C462E38|nr:protein phosphatase 2C domain-containing protein [Xanthomonas euvesicatoria]MBV6799624.1 protein phosphatase 2C domain-containing protein [Xanthomonas campestris pv. obscurae]
MTKLIECGGFSHPKNQGGVNQDSWLLPRKLGSGYIMAVADGVGSYCGAELASRAVIRYLSEIKTQPSDGLIVSNIMRDCREEISRISEAKPALKDAATTLTFCHLSDKGLLIGHVGDSRAYLRSNNKLIQITKDHTQHQNLFDQGIYTKRELKNHSGENILTSALSSRIEPNFEDIFIPHYALGDLTGVEIFLMSDGAHRFWTSRPQFSISTLASPTRFSSALKRRIDRSGATDDQTLVCGKFVLTSKDAIQDRLF